MDIRSLAEKVLIILIIVLGGLLVNSFYVFYSSKKPNVTLNTGVGSEYNTEKYYKELNTQAKEVSEKFKEGSPESYMFTLVSNEALILANMSTGDEDKKAVAVKVLNSNYSINQELISKIDKEGSPYSADFSKTIVSSYQLFEQYCFRYDWFIESNWAKDDIFKQSFAKYQNDKILAIFFGFSQKLTNIADQDNVVIGNNMRVVSYLLHSYGDKLTVSDKEMLIARLVSLHNAYKATKISKIYGTNVATQVYSLKVTPDIEYAYATEILSKYKPDLVSDAQVVKTYEETISEIKPIVDSNNKPSYMVNKFMWLHLMYLGYLYDHSDNHKITDKMIDLVISIDSYNQDKSPYKEGSESANVYKNAATNEFGSWDQIRKRAYAVMPEIRAKIKNK